MKNYVSNLITETTIKTLDKGKNYLIGSEMGSGKNYWVRNVLLPFADANNKMTLILSHRRIIRDQQNNYLKEWEDSQRRKFRGGLFKNITYQEFENKIERNNLELNYYDFIVCDESHYFTNDCTMNYKTELSFDWINNNTRAIKFFLTGTYRSFMYLPWNNMEQLKSADYYNSNVKEFFSYQDIDSITPTLEEKIINGEKVLMIFDKIENGKIFISSTNENARLLTSANSKTSIDYNSIITNQEIDSNILCSTSLLCEGVEIKDNETKTVVIDGITEIEKFVQSPARIRDNDITVYYKKPSHQKIVNRFVKFRELLGLIEEFEQIGEIEYIKKYKIETIQKSQKFLKVDTVIDPSSRQEYARLKLHKCNVANIKYQYDMYKDILENGFEFVLKEYFPNAIFYDYQELLNQELIKNKILDDFVGKRLFKEEQQQLKNLLVKEYGFKRSGIASINKEFQKMNIGFEIISKRIKINNQLNTIWILNKI